MKTSIKQTVSLCLALIMVLPLTACSQNKASTAKEMPPQVAVPQKISWDLGAIYPDEATFEAAFSQADAQIEALAALRGKLNTVDGAVRYYTGYDEATRLIGRLDTYTALQVYQDQSDSAAKALSGRVSNLLTQFSVNTAFALPELFANSGSLLDEVAQDARMKPYLFQFNHDRTQSAHTLPEAEEQLLQPLYQLRDGAASLYRTLANSDLLFPTIKFPDGTERTANESNYSAVSNREYPQEFRIAYANAILKTYGQFRNTFAQNMQNHYLAVTQLAADYKYGSALEADLILSDAPKSVYDGVLSAAEQAKPTLGRYFSLLKKSLNITTLYNFESRASIAKDPGISYSYMDAQKLVKKALAPLGTDYAQKLDVMLLGNAIDVYPAENKSPGGFCASVPGTHPYILLNYTNNFNSLTALSHELGHAVHMLYSQDQESIYNQNASIMVSEVASTLNELLLSDYLIENAKSEDERQYYAAQQISTLYSTFYDQIFYARFQEAAALEVENGGTLTADKLDELWIQAARDCFGDVYTISDAGASGWARISHFYSGFYVYQYAVGIAAACNIADRIQSGDAGAVEDYLAFLKAGGSGNVAEVLNIADVNVSNGSYISAFTTRFERLIAELESLNQKKQI